jgi:hypothetical protein
MELTQVGSNQGKPTPARKAGGLDKTLYEQGGLLL